jgi:hypothetical protein
MCNTSLKSVAVTGTGGNTIIENYIKLNVHSTAINVYKQITPLLDANNNNRKP